MSYRRLGVQPQMELNDRTLQSADCRRNGRCQEDRRAESHERHGSSMHRRNLSLLAALVLAAASTSGIARAQTDWPARTVTIVVPYAAGGNTDIMARMAEPEANGSVQAKLRRRQSRRRGRRARRELCRPGRARRLHAVLRGRAADCGAVEGAKGQLRSAQGFHSGQRVRNRTVHPRDRQRDCGKE